MDKHPINRGNVTNISSKNILITGGAGFIGSHLIDEVIRQNPSSITVVDNFFLGQDENLEEAVSNDLEVMRLDASDLTSMLHVLRSRDIHSVFNLAVVPLPLSINFPAWTSKTNIEIVTTFCELARLEEYDELLHVSSSEVYGSARYATMDEDHPHDVTTPYAASKSAGDQIVRSYIATYGVRARTVRPFNNFGPRQNQGSYAGIIPIVINRLAKDLPILITGDGSQTRDFVFVKETARGICDVFNNEKCLGGVFNFATGKETSILELVHLIMKIMNKEHIEIEFIPDREGDVHRHCADTSLFSSILGYSPCPLNEVQMRETVEWYLERLNDENN
jgi:UDP-glucose 4-epimerase